MLRNGEKFEMKADIVNKNAVYNAPVFEVKVAEECCSCTTSLKTLLDRENATC